MVDPKYIKLSYWFDRIYVINRPDRPVRLARFFKHIEELGLAERHEVIVYPAIMGNKTTCPPYFLAGAGAWGCLKSHSNIIENAIMEIEIKGETHGIDSILILEDDVQFIDDPYQLIFNFLSNIPKDWDQLYLGGQHRMKPIATENSEIKRVISTNRTHAYALNSKIYKKVYAHINNATDYIGRKDYHVDGQLEEAHRKQSWNVYCPPKWLAGQCANISDVSNTEIPYKIWD